MENLIREQTRVYLNKNKDYGDSYIDQLEKHGVVAFKVVAGFKVARILQHSMNNKLENESAKDSLLDLLNYSIMTNMWDSKDYSLHKFVTEIYKILDNPTKFTSYYLSALKTTLELGEMEYDILKTAYFELLGWEEEDDLQ